MRTILTKTKNKMENLTPTQKRKLLAELVTLKNSCGYDVINLIGHPLNKFDFNKVKNSIQLLIIEWEEINSCEYETPYCYEA